MFNANVGLAVSPPDDSIIHIDDDSDDAHGVDDAISLDDAGNINEAGVIIDIDDDDSVDDRTHLSFDDFQGLVISDDESDQDDYDEKLDRESSAFLVENHLPYETNVIESCVFEGKLITKGTLVELHATGQASTGKFLQVDTVRQSQGSTSLRGWAYRRNTRFEGMLEPHINEITMLLKAVRQDERDIMCQSLQTAPLRRVKAVRTLIKTNRPWPELSYSEYVADPSVPLRRNMRKEDIRNTLHLVCRQKHIRYFNSVRDRARVSTKPDEEVIVRLRREECDPEHDVADPIIRSRFRTEYTPAATRSRSEALQSYRINVDRAIERFAIRIQSSGEDIRSAIDIDNAREEDEEAAGLPENDTASSDIEDISTPQVKSTSTDSGAFTFLDAFCGAGGASCGARAAGLDVKFAFDKNETACSTYRHNFPEARNFCKEVFDFIALLDRLSTKAYKVDVVHLSPPCQYFSAAHTIAGVDDEANLAALYSVHKLVSLIKPRIVTIEETDGLRTHHGPFLYALINQLTSLGYSLRWKSMSLADFGIPQPRRRLIIVASCPGEPLPEMPLPTHGPVGRGSGLEPYTTVADALRLVRPGMANHNPEDFAIDESRVYHATSRARTLTTKGAYHPTGRRLTGRELASLQGFPTTFVFLGQTTRVQTQVGNAVPPPFMKVVYAKIIETLRATDAAEAGMAHLYDSTQGGSVERAIELD